MAKSARQRSLLIPFLAGSATEIEKLPGFSGVGLALCLSAVSAEAEGATSLPSFRLSGERTN